MKNSLVVALMFLLAGSVFGVDPSTVYTPNYQNALPGRMLGGEHTWRVLRGTALLDDPADSANTGWFKVSVSDSNSMDENSQVFDFDSDIMNLDISLSSSGDSIALAQIRVEFGWDNTGYLPIRNADSTFTVMLDGNYNLSLYSGNGGYLYEDIPYVTTAATTYDNFTWRYKIPIQGGAWCRITFVQHPAIGDNVTVTYTISLTH
jgi:hypothetical protein